MSVSIAIWTICDGWILWGDDTDPTPEDAVDEIRSTLKDLEENNGEENGGYDLDDFRIVPEGTDLEADYFLAFPHGCDLEGKTVQLKQEFFNDDHVASDRKCWFECKGGFGCHTYTIGRKIIGNFMDGENAVITRDDVEWVITPARTCMVMIGEE